MGPKLSLAGHALVRQIGAIALVAAVGLLIGACGSSNSPSASSSSASHSPSPSPLKLISNVDACKLVTTADASTATGTTVASLSSGAQIPGVCLYGTSDGTTSVIVFAQAYPDSATANAISPEQIAAAINGGVGVTNAKAVSGIGDKAVEYSTTTPGANGIVIFAFKSNVVVVIMVTPAVDPTKIEQLARTAVGKL
jgi:hypothetical protein